MSEVDSFCKNCNKLHSEHIMDEDNNFFENCPTDNGGFYLYVGFMPMTNLEYLERRYEENFNGNK